MEWGRAGTGTGRWMRPRLRCAQDREWCGALDGAAAGAEVRGRLWALAWRREAVEGRRGGMSGGGRGCARGGGCWHGCVGRVVGNPPPV